MAVNQEDRGAGGGKAQRRKPIPGKWMVVLAGVFLTPPTAAAQEAVPAVRSRPWLVTAAHYGRWGALASAAGLIAFSVVRRGDAQEALDRLETFCLADVTRCALVSGSGGEERYIDGLAEDLFRQHVRRDRQAQGLLIGGQAALLVTGGLFLIDLLWDDERPANIPYTPFDVHAGVGWVGLAIPF